jgi:integrase
MRGDVEPDDYMFTDEHGRPLTADDHITDRLRLHLHAAGLERVDLHSKGPLKEPFGLHCFRRSYVTRELANGRQEDHVRQRTGHKSTELLGYRQASRALAELSLGDVDRSYSLCRR